MATFDHVFTSAPVINPPMSQMNDAINPHDALSGSLMRDILLNTIKKTLTSTRITQEDVERVMVYIMNVKLINYQQVDMCKTPFGLQVAHNCTREDPGSLKTFQFIFAINKTNPADIVINNNMPSEVTLETVTKEIEFDQKTQISFSVEKQLYQDMRAALELIAGKSLPDNLKIYAGEQIIPNGSELLWKTKLTNYFQRVHLFSGLAANSISQGELIRQLIYIYSRSPTIYTLPTKETYKGSASLQTWALQIINTHIRFAYGINKLWKTHRECPTTNKWLNDILYMFKLNTSPAVTPELCPYFENAKFKHIEGVITVTENIRKTLEDLGLLNVAHGVTMVQKVSHCKIKQDDLHPFDTKAPHSSVILKNGGVYERHKDGSLITDEIRTVLDVEYIVHSGGVYILSCVTDGKLGGGNSMIKSGMKQISRYDSLIPTCIQLLPSLDDCVTSGPLSPIPQCTMFKDANGITRSLGFSKAVQFLQKIFNYADENADVFKNLPPEETDDNIQKTLMFFTVYRQQQSTEDDGENSESGGGRQLYMRRRKIIKLFKYTIENTYMTKEIFLTNVLNAYNQSLKINIEGELPDISTIVETWFNEKTANEGEYMKTSSNEIMKQLTSTDHELLFRNTIIVAAARELGFKSPPGSTSFPRTQDTPHDIMLTRLLHAYLYVLTMLNENMVAEHLDAGFNPGCGILWVKPQLCESESMIVSRPSGYTYISANPKLFKKGDLSDTRRDVHFIWEQFSAHCRNGLHPTSIKIPAAYLVHTITDDNDLTVNPYLRSTLDHISKCQSDDQLLNMSQGEASSRWWPILCDPKLPVSFFEHGGSPAGRLTSAWIEKRSFDFNFKNNQVCDTMYPGLYTVNKVFTNPTFNINTVFYNEAILNRPECPLNKYINFNPASSKMIIECQQNTARRDSLTPHGGTYHQTSKGWSRFTHDADFSKSTGIAFTKRCFTNPELLKQENQNRRPTNYQTNNIITSETLPNHFYMPGTGMQEKYDVGIGHYNFSN